MDWSAKQVKHYNKLYAKILELKSWKAIVEACFGDAEFHAPASLRDLNKAGKKLGRPLPPDLASLYLECGGVSANFSAQLVMPLPELIETNAQHRDGTFFADLYMPFDHLLLFGGEGNGSLFAYPIAIDGSYGNGNIYEWDHENDSRSWKAADLRDLLARLATD